MEIYLSKLDGACLSSSFRLFELCSQRVRPKINKLIYLNSKSRWQPSMLRPISMRVSWALNLLTQKKREKGECHRMWEKCDCWHRFLTRVKEGDFGEGKVTDLEETKRCTVLESADGVRPMDQRSMPWRCWFVRSGARPMESCRRSQGGRRGSGLYENLDDSVVIF